MCKRKIVGVIFVVLILLVITIGAGSVMFAETLPTDGLMTYYPFNGNANDESGNGNNGIVYGATLTADRFGNANQAYNFDGVNDYIDIPNSPSFNFSDSKFSLNVWVKYHSIKTDWFPRCNMILEKRELSGGNQGDQLGGFVLCYDGYTPESWWATWFKTTTGEYPQAHSQTAPLNLNNWYLLTAVSNGSSYSLFINGSLVSTTSYTGNYFSGNHDIYVGAPIHYLDSYSDAEIDDLRIYNRVLSDSEIQTLYHEGGWGQATVTPKPTPIITPTPFPTAKPTPTPAEIISNPGFENGIDGWHCIYNSAQNANADIRWDTADYDVAPASLKVQCNNRGNSYNAIQLFTGPFSIERDQTYLLTFKAKSSERFTIPYIKLNQGAAPWSDYATPYSNLAIAASGASTGWQNYAVIFKANTTAVDGRLTFFLGNALPDGAAFNIDTLSLKAIGVNPPPAGELLPNPGFDTGAGNWCCYSDASAQAYGGLDTSDYDSAPLSYRIQCINRGNSLNSIQLFTMPINIGQNKVYQLTFKTKCTNPFVMQSIRLMKAASPWTNYAVPHVGLIITPEWQSYSLTFTANTTAADGRITFFLGNGLPDGTVFHIDSLSLREME